MAGMTTPAPERAADPTPRYDRIAIDLVVLLALCTGAAWADDIFHSATPAACVGYILGVTAWHRFQWIFEPRRLP